VLVVAYSASASRAVKWYKWGLSGGPDPQTDKQWLLHDRQLGTRLRVTFSGYRNIGNEEINGSHITTVDLVLVKGKFQNLKMLIPLLDDRRCGLLSVWRGWWCCNVLVAVRHRSRLWTEQPEYDSVSNMMRHERLRVHDVEAVGSVP
jgi:hypothetical protein